MTIGLVPLTTLDAINEILATGSESPLSTIEDDAVVDASLANNTLKATSVEVQTKGWFFNETDEATLTPDQDGHIVLPLNTLRVDTVGDDADKDCVQRGNRLYNKTDRTYVFDAPVTVTFVEGLEFEELPSSARLYIMIKAARKYQDRYFGDDATHSYNKQDELEARAALIDEDIASRDSNMLSDSRFAQNLQSRR